MPEVDAVGDRAEPAGPEASRRPGARRPRRRRTSPAGAARRRSEPEHAHRERLARGRRSRAGRPGRARRSRRRRRSRRARAPTRRRRAARADGGGLLAPVRQRDARHRERHPEREAVERAEDRLGQDRAPSPSSIAARKPTTPARARQHRELRAHARAPAAAPRAAQREGEERQRGVEQQLGAEAPGRPDPLQDRVGQVDLQEAVVDPPRGR